MSPDESFVTTAARPHPGRTDPAPYPVRYRTRFRFADLDPNGHVNNVALGALHEDARTAVLRHAAEQAAGVQWLAVQHVAHYLAEGFVPAEVECCGGIGRIGTSSVVLSTALFSRGACLSVSDTVLVGRRDGVVGPLPETLRSALAGLALGRDVTDAP